MIECEVTSTSTNTIAARRKRGTDNSTSESGQVPKGGRGGTAPRGGRQAGAPRGR